MSAENLAAIAGAFADPTRARILVDLMDGRAKTAKEVAHAAGIVPSTATEHLNRLVGSGLLVERRQGRHRYVQLADSSVAHAIESVAALGNRAPQPVRSLRESTTAAALSRARTCYDHLAGELGVAIADALVERTVLTDSLELTPEGEIWWEGAFGPLPPAGRRPRTRACLDWTERRMHVAGVLGAHLCSTLQERQWVRPVRGTRAVALTVVGEAELHRLLGLTPTGSRRAAS